MTKESEERNYHAQNRKPLILLEKTKEPIIKFKQHKTHPVELNELGGLC